MTPNNREEVRMNPLGPHFYVNDSRPFDFPEEWRDAVTDVMNNMLHEVDQEHGWPITHEHIKGHETITHVVWNDEGFEIEPIEVSFEWYSREQIREYEH